MSKTPDLFTTMVGLTSNDVHNLSKKELDNLLETLLEHAKEDLEDQIRKYLKAEYKRNHKL